MIKNIYKKILIIGFFVLYTLGIILMCRCIGVDADKANHLLQADDILSGNFFMNDWNLTGVTFLTTDLLYYGLARILCGVSYRAVYVACGLMMASVFIVAWISCVRNVKTYRTLRVVLFGLLAAVPCVTYMYYFRVHTGAVFLAILGFLLCQDILKKEEKSGVRWLILGLVLCFGLIGDLLALLIGIIPIVVLCLFNILQTSDHNIKVLNGKMLGLTGVSCIVWFAWEKIYFSVSDANRNSYIGEHGAFTSLFDWQEKTEHFIDAILQLSMASFMNGKISDIWNLIKGINFVTVVVATVFVIRILVMWVKAAEVDVLSVLLSWSCVIAFLAYLLTELAQPRYITVIPVALMIILIRNIEWIIEGVKDKRLCIGLLLILSLISFSSRVRMATMLTYPVQNEKYYELITFMQENNLKHGYASFWHSSIFTVLSHDDVKIRHVESDNNGAFRMYNWFNKNEWYSETANCIIVDNRKKDRGASDSFGISEDAVIDCFGEPVAVYEVGDYLVITYDYDLSPYLTNGIKDNRLMPRERLVNANTEVSTRELQVNKDGVVYGPYTEMIVGEYMVIYEGENLDMARYDIWSDTFSGEFEYQEIIRTDNCIEVKLTVTETVPDMEYRLFNDTDEPVLLRQITINEK